MKYIKVLPDITLTRPNGRGLIDETGREVLIPLSFKEFVFGRLSDARFSKDMETMLRAFEIKIQIEKMSDYLVLEDADWKLLEEVTKKPDQQTAYRPDIALSQLPFIKAIVDATSTDPREKVDN